MDPLTALRTFVMNDELDQVQESGSNIDFGGRMGFDRKAATAYKSEQGKGEFYDVESVLFFLKNLDRSLVDYIKAAKEKPCMNVKLVDRKDLSEYLTGKRDTSEYIQLAAVPEPTGKAATGDQGAQLGGASEVGAASAPDAAVEQGALRTIIANERQLRDRNTMLSVPGRTFQRVLDLLDTVIKEEARAEEAEKEAERKRKADAKAMQKKAEAKRAREEASRPKPSGRYDREAAPDAALQQIGAQNLGLQQVGFAAAEAGPSDAAMAPPPPPPEAGTGPQRPSSQQQAQRRSSSQQKQQRPPQKTAPSGSGVPIILVPPAHTGVINMLNAPNFLINGAYQSIDAARAAGVVAPEKGYHSVLRTIGRSGHGVKYHITDKEPVDQEGWSRVVAVFCLGKPWQFKKFPFKGAKTGDLVDTFQRVCGVFLHYSDEPIDQQVKKWNVKMIKVGRHSREGDAEAVRAFWTHLDSFLKSRGGKKNLRY